MAKADLSDDVIKIAIGAILIGGIYLIYTTARAGQPLVTLTSDTVAAVQKPFTWAAEGAEHWSDWLTGLPADIVKAVDPEPERKLFGYDENSWLWGYGPKKG